MQKNIKYGEDILINLDDFEDSKEPVTLYAASNEGIYRVLNSEEIWKKVRKPARPLNLISTFSLTASILMLVGGFILVIVGYRNPYFADEVNSHPLFVLVYMVLMFALLVTAGVSKLVKEWRVSRVMASISLTGDLVAPWGDITDIMFRNRRTIEYRRYTEVDADLEIYTRSGSTVYIPNVKDANHLLDKIKEKFCPNCNF